MVKSSLVEVLGYSLLVQLCDSFCFNKCAEILGKQTVQAALKL